MFPRPTSRPWQHLLPLLICCCSLPALAQLHSVQIIPPNPTTQQEVFVVTEAICNQGCWTENSSMSSALNQTSITVSHCIGLLAFIHHKTDTFSLGMLPAGSHLVSVQVFRNSIDSSWTCPPWYFPAGSSSTSFTVSDPFDIYTPRHSSSPNRLRIYPNPGPDMVNVLLPNGDVSYDLRLLSLTGQQVLSTRASGHKTQLNIGHLPHGTYMLYATDEDGNAFQQRLIRLDTQ